ncbi:hypothetical protein [Aeromonas cavernicola]|nr:hypothetical protein [Aeromonas cavernicola]
MQHLDDLNWHSLPAACAVAAHQTWLFSAALRPWQVTHASE